MRALLKIAFVVALAACGQTASSGGAASAQAAGADAASGGGQAAFVAACVARYVAQSPQASQWAPDQCAEEWRYVVAAGPIADAILAAVGGTMPAAGRLGSDVEVTVTGRTIEFGWSEIGAAIPYDVANALAERGAPATLIGCAQVGAGEFQKAYSVTPAGGTAFPLGVYERTAPTGDAWSFYNVSAELGGHVKTLLRGDGSDWAPACAY